MNQNNSNTKLKYPTDGKLRPVEYTPEVDDLVTAACERIRFKHRKFMRDARIDFEDFRVECAARVWKGLTKQFTGSSSVKSYVYIICQNHWRNIVSKFFKQTENAAETVPGVMANDYSKLFAVKMQIAPDNTMERVESEQLIAVDDYYEEYSDDRDIEYDTEVLRKLVRFAYKHYSDKKLARAIIKYFSGGYVSHIAAEMSINPKRLTKEINKVKKDLGVKIVFNEDVMEFEYAE